MAAAVVVAGAVGVAVAAGTVRRFVYSLFHHIFFFLLIDLTGLSRTLPVQFRSSQPRLRRLRYSQFRPRQLRHSKYRLGQLRLRTRNRRTRSPRIRSLRAANPRDVAGAGLGRTGEGHRGGIGLSGKASTMTGQPGAVEPP